MRAMERLQKEGMKKLIFDLRDNSGGILGEAVDMVDEFLDENKLIVFTKGDKQEKFEYRCKRPGLFEKGQLVILVDEGSASASEVVAGALQDWDRATIVGRRTFGKGLVQEQYELSNGAALRLTVARYYTPTGRSIQKPYGNGRDEYYNEVLERFHSGEVVHPAHPTCRASANDVTRERCEDISIAQHQIACAQQRDQLPFVAVAEIRGVNQAERRRCQQFAFFSFAGRGLDQFARVPFREENARPFHLQPAVHLHAVLYIHHIIITGMRNVSWWSFLRDVFFA